MDIIKATFENIWAIFLIQHLVTLVVSNEWTQKM